MKLVKALALAAVVGLVSCVPARSFYKAPQSDQSRKSVVITQEKIKALYGGSAKYTVKEKIVLIDSNGKITEYFNPLWSGSAFCIGVKKSPSGVDYSIWVTCRHVADISELGTRLGFAEIDYIDKNGKFNWAKVEGVVLSKTRDIAVFTSLAIPRTVFELASDSELSRLELGDMLLAVGHPSGIYPPGLTLGSFLWESSQGYQFTVTATYGSSGSALIDAQTMKVIGVIYKFAGAKNRNGSYRSDDLVAVPVYELKQLLASIR